MKGVGWRMVRVQHQHQRRPFLHDPHPRVAMAVNPTLVALGQAKPPLQVEIVEDLSHVVATGKQAATERQHQPHHVVMNRVGGLLEPRSQLFELRLCCWQFPVPGSSVADTSWISFTDSRIVSCSLATRVKPRSMQPARRFSCFSANPLFLRPSCVGSTPGPVPIPRPSARQADEGDPLGRH